MSAEALSLLTEMLESGASEEAIRGAVEPLLAPGCTLEQSVENCITSSGASGYRRCGRVTGCDDSSNNSDWSCGGCQES
jgi:hypothetical protein